jgi:phosphatidylinositol phospholipase C, delta
MDISDAEFGPSSSEVTQMMRVVPRSVTNRVKTENNTRSYEPAKTGEDIDAELSKLVVYCESVPFKSFVHSRNHHKCSQMCSFVESKALALARKCGRDWAVHNVRQLSRIYPQGSRIDSSNYNPMPLWSAGCQMVALNIQTVDAHMQLNRAMFSTNGGSGYVLKPKPLCLASGFSLDSSEAIHGVTPVRVEIEVISGQHVLAPKKGNLAVGVELFGLPSDGKRFQTKRRKVPHPQWWETFTFERVRRSERG